MTTSFIMNGRGHGDVASTLMAHNFDPNCLRPYIGKDGRSYMTVNDNGKYKTIVTNAPTSLRRDDWRLLDDAILRVAKPRLRAFGDLRAAGLTYNVPNAMGKTFIEHELMGDISEATISMDGMRKSEADRPLFDIAGIPLPIIHKDFHYSARQLAASRNGGSPLDTTTAELAARRVAEEVDKLTVGTASSFSYGGGTIYGYTNHPNRITKTLTAPTTSNHAVTVNEILDMIKLAQDDHYYGPYKLYYSKAWTGFMNEDYSPDKGDNTLRQRIMDIDGIQDVALLEQLTGTSMLLVQMTSDVARAIIGMDITTVQWESHGGFQLNFKVLCILVPQIRADYDGNLGVVHASV